MTSTTPASNESAARSYRPDIDGLRAVAVLSVFFFHLNVPGFRGGYVGVDVFFVISGYLITSILLREIEEKNFSFKTFYLRRVRRLAPALLTVSVVTLIAAFLLLYPEDMRSFASSMIAQFVSLQNVVFFQEGEYFRGSETKLMLHTWSLAVEEQFYLFWPALLVAAHRFSPRIRVIAIVVVLVISFGANLAFMRVSPKASFFLLPARVWELAIGGLLLWVERGAAQRRLLSPNGARAIAIAGLGMIAFSTATFTKQTPFPGYAAIVPVVGAALVILAGSLTDNPLGSVLANRPLVRVGLVSYPLYLWHWPLIAATSHLGRDPSRPLLATIILVTSYVLAEGTYRYVETPIRYRKRLASNRSLVATAAGLAALLATLSFHSRATEGAAWRYPPRARALLTAPLHASSDRCGFAFRVRHPNAPVCPLVEHPGASRRVLLWGNSHADMWTSALSELALREGANLYLNARNCRATIDNAFCGAALQRAILDVIERERITDVVLASSWYGSYDIADAVFEEQLRAVVTALNTRRLRTWIVVDVPKHSALDPLAAVRANPNQPEIGSISVSLFDDVRRRERTLFATLTGVRVIDPTDAYCDELRCRAGSGDVVWYRDSHHLTHAGARAAIERFDPVFAR